VLSTTHLILCLLASVALCPGVAAGNYIGKNTSAIAQLALSLNQQPEARAIFAREALTQMADDLAAEAQLARRQAGGERGLLRWVNSVEHYVDTLRRLSAGIDAQSAVSFSTGAERSLFLRANGQSIVLSAPRIELQPGFEQQVIERFCSAYPCDDIAPAAAAPLTHSVAQGSAPRWSFSESDGPVCVSDDGLALQFANSRALADKRRFCLQVVAELRAIADALEEAQGRGVIIQWGQLSVRALRTSNEYQLTLNDSGDALLLELPASYGSPQLLVQARPWLRARADRHQATLVLENAEDLWSATQ
jgi:hypothetical protein